MNNNKQYYTLVPGRTITIKIGPDFDTPTNPGYGYRRNDLPQLISWLWATEESKAYPQG